MGNFGLSLMIIGGMLFTILPRFKILSALATFVGYKIFMSFTNNSFNRSRG